MQILHSKQGKTFIQNSPIASVLQLYQWVPENYLHLNTTSNLPHQLCFTQSSTLIPAVILSQQPLPAQQGAAARVNTEVPGMAGNTPTLLVTESPLSALCLMLASPQSQPLNPSKLSQGDKNTEQTQVATSLTQVHHALIAHPCTQSQIMFPFFLT